MTALILLLAFWAPYVLLLVIRRSHRACTGPPSAEAGTGVRDVLAWSALDDHQLTRLLTDAAARDATGS